MNDTVLNELLLTEGARIYYTGDMANSSDWGTITKVRAASSYAPEGVDITMDDGRTFRAVSKLSFKPGAGRRFWPAEERLAFQREQLRKFVASNPSFGWGKCSPTRESL